MAAWLGAAAGFLSLIFNFMGYGLMSVGLGRMIGFDLPRNVKGIFFVDSVIDFFRKFNYLVLNYLKTYIFPWWGFKYYGFKFLKTIIVAFFYVMFFGFSSTCFLTAFYFLAIVFLEKCLAGVNIIQNLKHFKKIFTLFLLLIGTVLFQGRGVFNNFSHLGAMFGLSGIFFDVSFVFVLMLIKFLLMIFILFLIKFLIKSNFLKFKILKNLIYVKPLGLLILFVFSVVLGLSQIKF